LGYEAYLFAVCNASDPQHFSDAIKEEKWCVAMDDELRALDDNGT